jgi:hypothetical protein
LSKNLKYDLDKINNLRQSKGGLSITTKKVRLNKHRINKEYKCLYKLIVIKIEKFVQAGKN